MTEFSFSVCCEQPSAARRQKEKLQLIVWLLTKIFNRSGFCSADLHQVETKSQTVLRMCGVKVQTTPSGSFSSCCTVVMSHSPALIFRRQVVEHFWM